MSIRDNIKFLLTLWPVYQARKGQSQRIIEEHARGMQGMMNAVMGTNTPYVPETPYTYYRDMYVRTGDERYLKRMTREAWRIADE